jgi:hypothetical protein
MALTQWRFLNNVRFNRIVGRLAAQLAISRPLTFLNRLNLVPALDDELIGRFTGTILAADIIADEQVAVVQESVSLDVVSTAIPKIKHGQHLGEKLLKRLQQFDRGQLPGGENALANWDMQLAENLILGVRQRMNALACAMMLDSYSYDRLGIKLSGATWGMPSNLKVTTGVTWATSATATPLNDIFAMDQVASQAYGITFDKVTMPTADFWDMVKTTEFANKATVTLGAAFLVTPAALKTANQPEMQTLATRILNKTIELDDGIYYERSNAGAKSSTRVLPAHKVLLSRTADERNDAVMDFANSIVQESGMVEGVPVDAYGPIGYYTPQSHDGNPPGWNAWAVARAFPRKHLPECTAVLTVG